MALLRRSLQAAETQFLQAAGFVVRRTFIEEAAVAPPSGGEQPPLRRAATLPSPKHEVLLADKEDELDDDVSTAVAEEVVKQQSWADLSVEEDSESEAASGELEDELSLAEVMRRECAFLRIVSVSMVLLDASQSAKHAVKEVKQCLRVCVQGLPAQKRMKWQNPLAWSVALALQRAGRQAFVKRSRLYVLVGAAAGHEDAEAIVVDLCAPRSSELSTP